MTPPFRSLTEAATSSSNGRLMDKQRRFGDSGERKHGRGHGRGHDDRGRGRFEPRQGSGGVRLTLKSFTRFLIPAPPGDLDALLAEKGKTTDEKWPKEFAEVETAVNGAKALLDAPDVAGRIAPALATADLYRGLKYRVTKDYNAQVVTNAWLKEYEMIVQLNLIPPGATKPIRAFFNAELPGAFAVAMNHYVRTRCQGADYRWVASSYYPLTDAGSSAAETSTILGDTYGLFANNPDNWIMDPPGADVKRPNNGDITDADNIIDLAKRAEAKLGGKATFYTSDAGIDVSGDYMREEELTSGINLGQVTTGLMALAEGGDMLTKTYLFTKPFSYTLMVVLSSLFTFYITKPTTSRPANSEVYAVGRGYKGISRLAGRRLVDIVRQCHAESTVPAKLPALITSDAIAPTLAVLLRATRQIHLRQQVDELTEVVRLCRAFPADDIRRRVAPLAQKAQAQWLSDNPILPIKTADHLRMNDARSDPRIVTNDTATLASKPVTGGAPDLCKTMTTAKLPNFTLRDEYATWRLTTEILDALTKGANERARYETSNILERWLHTLANTRPADAKAKGPVYWEDPPILEFCAELVRKGIASEDEARKKFAQVVDQVKKADFTPRDEPIPECDGETLRCGDFAQTLTDRAAALLKVGTLVEVARAALRYAAIIDGGQQWGLTQKHADALYDTCLVRNEGFASPFNSRFRTKPDTAFFSLFPDVDAPFGSHGNFFAADMTAHKGNWLVNPPFVNDILETAARKVIAFVASGTDARVFFFMPAWRDSPCYQLLTTCTHTVLQVTLKKPELELPSGKRFRSPVECFYFVLASKRLDDRAKVEAVLASC
ncbi:MAG: hypothetical protein KGL39_01580 [Patescibacteria group bacterium]|nr:hypothetical protein [Patescibacteria group bacterium]